MEHGGYLGNIDEEVSSIKEKLDQHFKYSILAHLKTAIERYALLDKKKPIKIIYRFIDFRRVKRNASVRYYREWYIIYVRSDLSIKKQRYLIGHELSHILISLMEEKIYNPGVRQVSKKRESFASLLSYEFHIEQSKQYKKISNSSDFIYHPKDYDKIKQEILTICSNKK